MLRTHWILAFAATLAVPAFSEEPPKAASPKTAQEESPSNGTCDRTSAPAPAAGTAVKAPAQGSANLVVTKDPETGELRPATTAEREKLLGRKPLVPVERKVVTLPDGSQMIELGEADLHYAVVTKAPDGTIKGTCVHGESKVEKKPTPAPPTADR